MARQRSDRPDSSRVPRARPRLDLDQDLAVHVTDELAARPELRLEFVRDPSAYLARSGILVEQNTRVPAPGVRHTAEACTAVVVCNALVLVNVGLGVNLAVGALVFFWVLLYKKFAVFKTTRFFGPNLFPDISTNYEFDLGGPYSVV